MSMEVGQVKWFNDAKGFGFIIRNSGEDVFVHYSVIEGTGYRSLYEGQEVEFECTEGPKGLLAQKVIRPGDKEKMEAEGAVAEDAAESSVEATAEIVTASTETTTEESTIEGTA